VACVSIPTAAERLVRLFCERRGAVDALAHAEAQDGTDGLYALQAAIAACHARAARAWGRSSE
jgi:predicted RNA polymerase sigma factor